MVSSHSEPTFGSCVLSEREIDARSLSPWKAGPMEDKSLHMNLKMVGKEKSHGGGFIISEIQMTVVLQPILKLTRVE